MNWIERFIRTPYFTLIVVLVFGAIGIALGMWLR